jgi:hypothetical protein
MGSTALLQILGRDCRCENTCDCGCCQSLDGGGGQIDRDKGRFGYVGTCIASDLLLREGVASGL